MMVIVYQRLALATYVRRRRRHQTSSCLLWVWVEYDEKLTNNVDK